LLARLPQPASELSFSEEGVEGVKQDLDHLRLLSIFYYVLGGLHGLCACFPLFHLTVGVLLVSGAFPAPKQGEAIPEAFGWFFILFASAAILLGWTFAICLIVAGRMLQQQRGYLFCLVVAAIACIFMPLGTVLGVFTLIVLLQPSVKELFGRSEREWGPREMENG
jgi:hypothetical protein